MAVSPRLIRRRIRSVTNTRKITKAMEMVSAAKMRKAVAAVLATRPYAESAWRAVREIAKSSDSSIHPLLRSVESLGRDTGATIVPGTAATALDGRKKSLVLLFTPDRGLCGGVLSRLFRELQLFLKSQAAPPDFVAVGKKGIQFLGRYGLNLIASFDQLTKDPRVTDIRPAARLAIDGYSSGEYGSVYIAFTDYRSASNQEPVIRPILPLRQVSGLGETGTGDVLQTVDANAAGDGAQGKSVREFIFEPSPDVVLETMLPRLIEVQVWQALLESLASEHAARMLAMRTASDAASDMISGLTLSLNQARQAAITQEIAEISSGKAALG